MTALTADGLGVSFGGVHAVREVSLSVEPGERRVIIGPNGAGKTTLFNLLGGQIRPDAGKVALFGTDITALADFRRTALGLARTFQISKLFPNLTIRESVLLAAQGTLPAKRSLFRSPAAQPQVAAQAAGLLERWELMDVADEPVRNLSHGSQRQLEIILALASSPRLLLLDEPAAGLSSAERELLVSRIKELDRTLTIVLVEHDMDVVFEIADSITVMNYGAVAMTGPPEQIRHDPLVHEIYFGDGA